MLIRSKYFVKAILLKKYIYLDEPEHDYEDKTGIGTYRNRFFEDDTK